MVIDNEPEPKLHGISGGYFNSAELRILGFRAVGENCRVSKRVEIQDPGKIELGSNVRIDAFVTITTGQEGYLKVSSNTHIADGVRISAAAGVEIGEFVGIASRVVILSSSDDYSGEFMVGPLSPSGTNGGRYGLIRIHDYVVIGTSSVVFPGSTLEVGVAVGALSLVNRSLSSWGVYFGLPVKFMRKRSQAMLLRADGASSAEGIQS